MVTSRQGGHAICVLGHLLFVVGGVDKNRKVVSTIEKFNVIRKDEENKWV